MDELQPRPWTTNQMRRLGKAVANGETKTQEVTFRELTAWNNSLIFLASPRVRDAVAHVLGTDPGSFRIGSRAKTLETVRDKLIRDAHRPLQNVQDLAGIRVTADMNLDEQRAVAEQIARDLRQPDSSVQSLLDGEHAGYRALHVVCRFPQLGGAFLEVQVRTVLQNSWANLYDALSDTYGRGIRYGDDLPSGDAQLHVAQVRGLVRFQVADLEQRRTEIAQLKRDTGALTVSGSPDLQRRIDDLESDVEERALFLRRTMEAEERRVRAGASRGDT